mgnify:FL=1
MEFSVNSDEMQNEIDRLATTFLDQIGLQSSKTTATSDFAFDLKVLYKKKHSFDYLVKGQCLNFLGLLCRFYPEHMKKYADPLLLGQYLKYLHEQVSIRVLISVFIFILFDFQLVKDVVKFEMLIAAGAIEGLTHYLVNFLPSSTSGRSLSSCEYRILICFLVI